MKRVVIITTSFPSKSYDAGQEAAGSFVIDFAIELSNEVDVVVVAPSTNTLVSKHEHFALHTYESPILPLSHLDFRYPSHWRHIFAVARRGYHVLSATVDSMDVDHILALWALPSGYWARAVRKSTGVPYSTWALGSDIWQLGRLPGFRTVLKRVLTDASYRFADGLELGTEVESISNMECIFLPSSRDLSSLPTTANPEGPPYRFAFLGRWHPNKGVDVLLRCLSSLSADEWKSIAEVRIFGGGPLAPLVTEECRRLRKSGLPVHCGGYLNKQEAIQLLDWSHFVLIPSRIESIPVIFSDAMQRRRPIVAQPVGDLPNLIKQYGIGIQSETNTDQGFLAALRRAIIVGPEDFTDQLEEAAAYFSIRTSAMTFYGYLRDIHEGMSN